MTRQDDPSEQAAELRQQAEARLRAEAAQSSARLSSEETQPGLHELRVHQIELEMQNEELCRAQAELEASRARYFDLYDLAPVGYLQLSEPGLIVEANLTAATLLGVERSRLVGRPLTGFIVPEDEDSYYLHLKRLFETRVQTAFEIRLLKPHGAYFWAQLEMASAQEPAFPGERPRPGPAADGAPVYRVVLSDITERKLVEAALRASEERYRGLFEHMAEGYAYCQMIFEDGQARDWIYLAVNDAFETLTGLKHMVGKCASEALPGIHESDPELLAIYAGVSLTGLPQRFETFVAALQMWFSVSVYSPRKDFFVAAFDVITARKQAEAALQRREREFSTLVENAPDMIVRFDTGLRHLYCNAAVERQLGAPAHTFLGKTPQEIAGRPAAAAEVITRSLRQVLETGEEREVEQSYPTPFGLKYFHTRVVPERDAQGRIESLLAITRDITAHKQAEAALAQEQMTRAQLVQAEKLAGINRVIASVAHELNNPLQTIRNCLYLTNLELTPDSPIHQYLEMTTSETQRLVDLVAQLRELYRPRSADKMRPVNLSRLIEAVQTLFVTQRAGQPVVWHCPPALAGVTVTGTGDQLKQVFINLSQNALDAMQPTSGSLTIEMALSMDKRQVGVAFRDSGPGIPPENIDRLFEPFFTTRSTGLGLGLAICHDIVQKHGGRLTVESQLGQGAVFTVWLPLVQLAESEHSLETPGDPPDATV